MELHTVPIDKPDDFIVILGQAHFIETVEFIHAVLAGSSPPARRRGALRGASGRCLIR
jgi:adenosine/AMP kinase